MPGPKSKKVFLIAGALFASLFGLCMAGICVSEWQSAECPLRLTLIKIRPQPGNPDMRNVTMSLSNSRDTLIMIGDRSGHAEKRGGVWMTNGDGGYLSYSHWLAKSERVEMSVTRSTEAVRLRYDYARGTRLPLGLRSPLAGYLPGPESRAAAWLREKVQNISPRAYRWLWPDPSKADWRVAELELNLPSADWPTTLAFPRENGGDAKVEIYNIPNSHAGSPGVTLAAMSLTLPTNSIALSPTLAESH